MEKDKMLITVLSFIVLFVLVFGTAFYLGTIVPLQQDNFADNDQDGVDVLTQDQIDRMRRETFQSFAVDLVPSINDHYSFLLSRDQISRTIQLNGSTEFNGACFPLSDITDNMGGFRGHVILELIADAPPGIYFYYTDVNFSARYMTPAQITNAVTFSAPVTDDLNICPTGSVSITGSPVNNESGNQTENEPGDEPGNQPSEGGNDGIVPPGQNPFQ